MMMGALKALYDCAAWAAGLLLVGYVVGETIGNPAAALAILVADLNWLLDKHQGFAFSAILGVLWLMGWFLWHSLKLLWFKMRARELES
jgi:hypothetical protein